MIIEITLEKAIKNWAVECNIYRRNNAGGKRFLARRGGMHSSGADVFGT